MLKSLTTLLALLALSGSALAAPIVKHPTHKRHYTNRSVPGYGFLPGVRTPRQIERDNARAYYTARSPRYYGPAWPGFYHGRWNGGGFGPCYTQTPIGYVWNCGR
ncbi:MAG TPA: hypothetical protein VGM57_03355 [Pseudolabrys sp.]